jgi:hypothetical protein
MILLFQNHKSLLFTTQKEVSQIDFNITEISEDK